MVGAPKVLYKEENGKKLEPVERFVCDVPSEYMGAVMEKLGSRKGRADSMSPAGRPYGALNILCRHAVCSGIKMNF